jgi:MoaA/NifB/PqqE/SkfB family radical SAM enzyme
LEQHRAADFESGFIAESPAKMRRLQQYFAAVQGTSAYPPVHCNAPEFSAVVGVRGTVQPCFFIAGPKSAANDGDLEHVLNQPEMIDLRNSIRAGQRAECVGCVCSLYRETLEP